VVSVTRTSPSHAPVVLASFGGHGLQLPYGRIAQSGRFTLVLTDHESGADEMPASLIRLTSNGLREQGLRYADLVAASDVVVTKPGYGIVSECIGNGASLLYTSRGRFAEYDAFVNGMPPVLRCREIPQADLLAGRWAGHIEALMDQPSPPAHLALDGAARAAEAIMSLGDSR
jgi:L-arabinokinase